MTSRSSIINTSDCRRIAVVGGGASGCMAALGAARDGCEVDLFEKNKNTGKKIRATGNGRCNLTNLILDETCYRTGGSPDPAADPSDRARIREALRKFSREDLLRFFAEAGVPVHDRDGYVYPRTDQAETVAMALEKQLRNMGVHIHTDSFVLSIESAGGDDPEHRAFRVLAGRENGRDAAGSYDAVIVCTGGLAGPEFGCSGDGYRFARSFSHSVVEPLPSLTKLQSGLPFLKRAAGVRCHAAISLFTGQPASVSPIGREGSDPPGSDRQSSRPQRSDSAGSGGESHSGRPYAGYSVAKRERSLLAREEGELQINADSLSGIPVFQLSGLAARALAQGDPLFASIDFLPEFTEEAYTAEVGRRLSEDRGQTLGSLFLGLVHRKVIDLLLACAGLQAEMKARRLTTGQLRGLFMRLRAFDVGITGTGSFSQAQVSSGGVPLSEVDGNFCSRLVPGLYLAGELLDVDGRCGGYNLQWAMTSGWLAGRAAAGQPVS